MHSLSSAVPYATTGKHITRTTIFVVEKPVVKEKSIVDSYKKGKREILSF
jgi:hypothetical protein